LIQRWQPVENLKELQKDGVKGTYRVDVGIPADEWINITKFYDVLIFNTGHWSVCFSEILLAYLLIHYYTVFYLYTHVNACNKFVSVI
jgi:hypothetical protein